MGVNKHKDPVFTGRIFIEGTTFKDCRIYSLPTSNSNVKSCTFTNAL